MAASAASVRVMGDDVPCWLGHRNGSAALPQGHCHEEGIDLCECGDDSARFAAWALEALVEAQRSFAQ